VCRLLLYDISIYMPPCDKCQHMFDNIPGQGYIIRVICRTASRMGGMTLQALLQQYSMKRPIDLARALDIDRRYAWMLWHGHRKFTAKLALRLYEEKGIPIHELLRAQVAPEPVPRGRPPRQQPPEEEG
jgi:plasmid maintenance system antidote protein VapI